MGYNVIISSSIIHVGTGLLDGPPENAEHFSEHRTELPLRGRTVKDAGPYIFYFNIFCIRPRF